MREEKPKVTYTIKVDQLRLLTIREMLEVIEASPKKPLQDLRLFDLLLGDDRQIALRHGIYMFFDDQRKCIYVGMCTSSHFAHRIGGHFGMSPKYGMNTFLRRAVRDVGLDSNTYESYVEVLARIGSYQILIIDANNTGKKFIRALERLLHTTIKPRLNFPKGIPKTYSEIEDATLFQSAIARCGGS